MMQTDVLIVGAGPTGLFLANELKRHNVDFIIADIGKGQSDLSRATGIHSQTLELFDYLDLLDEFLEKGILTDEMRVSTESRSYSFTTKEIKTRFPFGISIEQEKTEDIFKTKLDIKTCKALMNHQILGIRERPEKCSAFALDLKSNNYELIEAKFIVGCDGVNSTVRKENEIDFIGEKYGQNMLAADLILEGKHLQKKRLETYLNDNGLLMLFGLPEPNKYRIFADVDDDFDCTENSLVQLINQRGRNETVKKIIWANTFLMNKKIASKYGTSRVYLAGDSCHSHSPAGGHGMNIGIMDAFNLAWKLKLVIEDIVSIDFLKSYELERRPIAEKVLFRSDVQTDISFWDGKLLGGIKEFLLGLLNNFKPFREEILKFAMELNMNYSNSPLNGQYLDFDFNGLYKSISRENEIPDIIEHNAFINGPKLGERFPDLNLNQKIEKYLYSMLINSNHTLLFFDGDDHTSSGYEKFNKISDLLTREFNDYIDCFLITDNKNFIENIDKNQIINDSDGELHSKYAAYSESLYFIRPDGFIAYRALPIDFEHIKNYIFEYKNASQQRV